MLRIKGGMAAPHRLIYKFYKKPEERAARIVNLPMHKKLWTDLDLFSFYI